MMEIQIEKSLIYELLIDILKIEVGGGKWESDEIIFQLKCVKT